MDSASPPLELLLRKLELRVRLSDEDRRAVLGLPHTMRTLEPSTYLTREGDLPDRCGVLASGYAYAQKLTGDGDRQIISLHIPGDALDLRHLFLDVADHSVQMLTRGDCVFIPRNSLQALVRSRPRVLTAIMVDQLVDASISREWVLNVGRRNAPARLAHMLCEYGTRLEVQGLGGRSEYELPITQEQLADALGLTTVHVNRTLKVLEARGLISRGKRSITFPDWERLREAGDFNQRYLHLEQQKGAAR